MYPYVCGFKVTIGHAGQFEAVSAPYLILASSKQYSLTKHRLTGYVHGKNNLFQASLWPFFSGLNQIVSLLLFLLEL